MKLLIAALLAVFSTSAMAEWTAVAENEKSVQYADLATIRKSGNAVKMWNLLDYKVAMTVGNTRYLSMTNQFEYDCKEEVSKMLTWIRYSKNMGQGEAVSPSGAMHEEPRPISPGSVGETFFKVACGK